MAAEPIMLVVQVFTFTVCTDWAGWLGFGLPQYPHDERGDEAL